MFVEGEPTRCPPGTFVYVPKGVPHTFTVLGTDQGTKLNLFTPAAMVGFFEDLAAAEGAGVATPALLDEISRQHHMEVVGPVPDTYL
jgi:hypothetical protein